MISKVDHIGIAVKSAEDAARTWGVILGAGTGHIEEVSEQKSRVAFIPVGETHIEFIEPMSPDSPVAKFIEAKGEGIHHIAVRVSDIEETLRIYREAGMRLIDEAPRKGAGGARIAFVHPKSANGVLLELCERSERS